MQKANQFNVISILIVLSFLAQAIVPVFAQGPYELPPADPAEHLPEVYEPTGPLPNLLAGTQERVPEFRLPKEADTIAELVTGRVPIRTATRDINNGETATVTVEGASLAFLERQLHLVIPPNTFAQPTQITLQSDTPSRDGEQLRFHLEAIDRRSGRVITTFSQPIHIVADLRTLNLLPSDWYIAYQDEEDPGRWHYLPTTIHDQYGLASVSTTHFSTWGAGSQSQEPEGWQFSWEIPAVNEFTGATTYNFPIDLPQGRAGLTPNIDLRYSSRAVDSLIFNQGLDHGPLGLGWHINHIEIARVIRVGDFNVHHLPEFSLVLDGQSYTLVRSSPVGNTTDYYAINAPQLRIQQIHDASAPNIDKLYWQVTTPTGTVYRLGYTSDAELYQEANYGIIDVVNAHIGDQHAGASSTHSGIRWLVDTVTDLSGNQIQYDYFTSTEDNLVVNLVPVTTKHYRPQTIRYNYDTPAPNPTTRITSGIHASQITFQLTGYRNHVTAIELYHVNLTTPYRVVDLDVTQFITTNGDENGDGHDDCGIGPLNSQPPNSGTWGITAIQVENFDGSLALPPTTLTYDYFAHTPHNVLCYRWPHLTTVDNGYGGQVGFTYQHDGRYDNGSNPGNGDQPEYGLSYFVDYVELWDGVHPTPGKLDYTFGSPCFDQLSGEQGSMTGATNCPTRDWPWSYEYGHGSLVGFNIATLNTFDYDGTLLDGTITRFWRGLGNDLNKMGRPYQSQAYLFDGTLLQQQDIIYATDSGSTFDFTYTSQVTTKFDVRGDGASTEQKTTYVYGQQNGVQYGNLTEIHEEGDTAITGDERHTYRTYTVNPTSWLVNILAEEEIRQADDTTLAAASRYYYDNNLSVNDPPNMGRLTSVEQWNNSWQLTQQLQYDPFGNVTQASDALGRTVVTTYDSDFDLLPVTITNPLLQLQTFAYFGLEGVPQDGPQAGLLKTLTDLNGIVTEYHYDPFSRLDRVIRDGDTFSSPSEFYLYYDYVALDAPPFMISKWTKTQNGGQADTPGGIYERHFYDGFGNEIQVQRPHTDWNGGWAGNGTGQRIISDMTYNVRGEIVSQSQPYFQNALPYNFPVNPYFPPDISQNQITSDYDGAGRTVQTVGLDGATNSMLYGRLASYGHDANGHIRASYFDVMGQLIGVDETIDTFADTFDSSASLNDWGEKGNVTVNNGMAHITGDNSYNNYISRTLTTPGDHGTIISFQADTDDPHSYINIDNYDGIFPSANYRGWWIRIDDGQLHWHEWTGTSVSETALMDFEANRAYRLMYRLSRSTTEFVLLLWPEDAPQEVVEIRRNYDSSWQQPTNWRFLAQTHDSGATLSVDNYDELDFNRTSYTYDTLGNLGSVVDPVGNTTTMTYDYLSRKVTMDDPDMGLWSYTYDVVGNLDTQTDALGQVIDFTYDDLNRLTEKKTGSGTLVASYTYDQGTNGIGRRTGMTAYDALGWFTNGATWVYDERGRVIQEDRDLNTGHIYTFGFGYSEGDILTRITYPKKPNSQVPEDVVTTKIYWPTGTPKGLVGASWYVKQSPGASYNAVGQLTSYKLGNNDVTTLTYDTAFRLQTLSNNSGYQDLTYSYDNIGNISQIVDDGFTSGGDQTQTFTYDSLNRLTSAKTIGNNLGSYNETYAYDALGNLLENGAQGQRYTDSAHPHAVTHLITGSIPDPGIQHFWYDANGNQTRRIDEQGRDWTQDWTLENKLATATNDVGDSLSFEYDADGMLVRRTENGDTTLMLGKLYQNDLTLNLETKHYFFNGQMVAQQNGSGVRFFLNDHLGSTTTTVRANGTKEADLRYDPWGNERYSENTTPTGYRYTNQRRDDALGLNDYNARYYDPTVGRFISADSIVPISSSQKERLTPLTVDFHEYSFNSQSGIENRQIIAFGSLFRWNQELRQEFGISTGSLNPQNLNRFSYVVNNPLRFID